ncbi:MAG: hypothetical protein M1822_008986 [Bathelium mastoideum]|nr:MAG: hypothetical protein M1822_008986 [Bathelium mastoideum]
MAGFFPNPDVPGLDPDATKGPQLVASGVTMIALSFIAIVLRFTSRWLIDARILLDDWLILCALPFAWAEGIVDINGTYHYNFGQHIAHATPSILEGFLAATWAFQLLYNFAIAFAKLSILALYWRIFHVPSFKVPLLLTTSLVMSWLVGCMFAAIFSCTPVDGFWKLAERQHCINNIAFYIGQAVGNIIIDLCLLALPIMMISRLQISLSQKIAVMGIFLLGAFVTLTSALRLWQLILTQEQDQPGEFDPTWTLVGAAVWSTVECNLSIVCACLPSMRPLLRLVLHGTLRNTEYGASYASGRSGRGNYCGNGGALTPGGGVGSSGKRASGSMWDRGAVAGPPPPPWTAPGGGAGATSKRSSFFRVPSRDVHTDGRGVRVDDDGFRVSASSDLPLWGPGRRRSRSMKGYVEQNNMELDTAPTRPRAPPRALTSPIPEQVGSRAPVKNWFDAGSERVSESSDEIPLAQGAAVVESEAARLPPNFSKRPISPTARMERPPPRFVGAERRGTPSGDGQRTRTPSEPWRLEIEKTTDVIVTQDRRR